jgi:hypothetical protein
MDRRTESAIKTKGSITKVELSQGRWAVIDTADLSLVQGFIWYVDADARRV